MKGNEEHEMRKWQQSLLGNATAYASLMSLFLLWFTQVYLYVRKCYAMKLFWMEFSCVGICDRSLKFNVYPCNQNHP